MQLICGVHLLIMRMTVACAIAMVLVGCETPKATVANPGVICEIKRVELTAKESYLGLPGAYSFDGLASVICVSSLGDSVRLSLGLVDLSASGVHFLQHKREPAYHASLRFFNDSLHSEIIPLKSSETKAMLREFVVPREGSINVELPFFAVLESKNILPAGQLEVESTLGVVVEYARP